MILPAFAAGFFSAAARATTLDDLGVTALQAVTTNLDGRGICVAQPEASAPAFEVYPVSVGQPTGLFTYFSSLGYTNGFPNNVGSESSHANEVARNFYGMTGKGVATNVAHVDNFDADYFVNTYVVSNLTALNDLVVNQSFIFTETNGTHATVSEQQEIDSAYDDYAAQYGTIFVSGAGNGGPVNPSATCYNGLGVADYGFGGGTSYGPTLDNGRCKPDITALSDATSYSTPQVSGGAVLLLQAALRGDGGNDTNSASDLRTIKALLLNGAVKPVGWTNGNSAPLDARYGAGVLNVLNSYEQLAGGKQNPCSTNSVAIGGAHLPVASTNPVPVTSGWNFQSLASSTTNDEVNHYFFDVSKGFCTITLVWNRQSGQSNINDLNLFLFDAANSNLVGCSTSLVDNVEHIYMPELASGRYDLQVWKAGGSGIVSTSEAYALAWQFVPSPMLAIAKSGTDAALTWSVYPAGFRAETRTNLLVGAWSTNNLPSPVLTNGQAVIWLSPTNDAQFFQLRQQP